MLCNETALSTIEKWKGLSSGNSLNSKDKLVRVIDKGFDAMSHILSKDSDYENIYRALDLLDRERSISLKFETVKNDSVRDLVYGLLESVYLTLNELTEELNQMKERERMRVKETRDFDMQTEKEESAELSLMPPQVHLDLHPTFENTLFDDAMDPKLEPFEDEEMNAIEMNQSRYNANHSTADSIELLAAKEESISPPILFPEYQDDAEAPSAMPNEHNDDNVNEETNNNEDVMVKLTKDNEESSENKSGPSEKETVKRKRGRPSRAVIPLNYAQLGTECDPPSVKKTRKSAPAKVNTYFGADKETIRKGVSKASAKGRISEVSRPWQRNSLNTTLTTKRSGTEMECVECPLKTKSIKNFVAHLRRNHQTTMNLANLVFLCECGNKSRTDWHNSQCDKANFTILKVNDDPIRRIGSANAAS